ncbi:MAG TPA: hypothetical protein PK286_06585 [Devosia sp.]|nr:hypothetical protein [Devosia sp.]
MKTIIAGIFAATTLLAVMPLPALAAVNVAAICDGSVPEGWKRPGGFCAQTKPGNSLSAPVSPGCAAVASIDLNDVRQLVASRGPCDPCYGVTNVFGFKGLVAGDRVRTAC